MSEHDPTDLANQREDEIDEMQRRVDGVAGQIDQTREDWGRKRADDDVPGAPPLTSLREGAEHEERERQPSSPAPQAPPEEEGPADSEATSEGATGPPADTLDDDAKHS